MCVCVCERERLACGPHEYAQHAPTQALTRANACMHARVCTHVQYPLVQMMRKLAEDQRVDVCEQEVRDMVKARVSERRDLDFEEVTLR